MARLDLAWPEARCAYELDSRRWHATPAAHHRDIQRHNALRALGWTVFQATPALIADPSPAATGELAAPVLAVLAALGAPPVTPPATATARIPEGGARPCA